MPDSFNALALLACPLGMGAMMWMMMRKQDAPSSSGTQAQHAELASLHPQTDQLQAQQRDASRTDNSPL